MIDAGITAAVAAFAAADGEPVPVSADALALIDALREAHPQAAEPDLAAGAEVALRIIAALDGHVEGGWSRTSAALVVGSAVAGSRWRKLDSRTAERAIGLAATQAGGLEELEAGPLGALQRAHAVRAGAEAAELAATGVEGHRDALAGRRGLFALVAPGADPSAIADGLGDRWLIRPRTSERTLA
ncbi:MmgE/PrpD family protein [Microbacterium sp. Root180]|uniref:MmgE/PrpD family protein n=1 Tax=Microbacterium sp. Root180 TaxID=1736483 RepID=UPI0006F94282|nr:MmgE/PrpD family protein [Microbacterium sp. Root180]KRB36643.1 hypothetical protein ASD93_11360 [Microbacterium sp. Root180]